MLDRVLDKGIVFDSSVRASFQIQLASAKLRAVVADQDIQLEHPYQTPTQPAVAPVTPESRALSLADVLERLVGNKVGS